jgi:hypothetical protein
VGSNVVGADAALTLLIEQLQAVLHDALAGFDSECDDRHLTTYPRVDKTMLFQDVI